MTESSCDDERTNEVWEKLGCPGNRIQGAIYKASLESKEIKFPLTVALNAAVQ